MSDDFVGFGRIKVGVHGRLLFIADGCYFITGCTALILLVLIATVFLHRRVSLLLERGDHVLLLTRSRTLIAAHLLLTIRDTTRSTTTTTATRTARIGAGRPLSRLRL